MAKSSIIVQPTSPAADIVAGARLLATLGLNHGATGNISVRDCERMLITPSGVNPDRLAPASIVEMTLRGEVKDGSLKPSGEWRMHRDIYRSKPDAGAVVHVHSDFATALGCARRSIPAFHYMVAAAGGDSIRCAAYATFGTDLLSRNVVTALAGRTACLLENHGMVATAKTLEGALDMAIEVESLAKQFWLSLQAGGPVLIDDDEMSVVLDKFGSYGQQD
jgi:L-fuculose-phosphate aldolase